jgi:membrane protein DedA with SNARE-associated domain
VIERLLAHAGYLAVTGLLVAGGLGVPVPEELVQLTAGVLAHRGVLSLPLALLAAWGGIVVGDLLWFRLARRAGPALLERPRVQRVLTPRRRAWVERHVQRHPVLLVVVARHASGLRLVAFALAAVHGVRTRTFVLADSASALLSVPLVVTLGYLSSAHLAAVEHDVRRVELTVVAVALLGAGAWAWWRRRRA